MARADKLRQNGAVVAVSPGDAEALCVSLRVTRSAVRTEKIARIREQIRQGTYQISAAEVAKAILRSDPSHGLGQESPQHAVKSSVASPRLMYAAANEIRHPPAKPEVLRTRTAQSGGCYSFRSHPRWLAWSKPCARPAGPYCFCLTNSTCSNPRSAASCARMYWRTASSSCPTVVTKYPRAQKCSPTKFCCRPPYVRAI